MPVLHSIANGSSRAYRPGSGDPRILLSAPPAAIVTTYGEYIVFQFTASATLTVGSGAPAPADVFVLTGGAPGFSGSGGAGGPRNAYPNITITGGSPIPVVVGGSTSSSSFGPRSSNPGTAGGTPGGSGSGVGGNGPTNNYLTGVSQNWGGGGGGGGGVPFQAGGGGGASGGGNGGQGGRFPSPDPKSPIPAASGQPGAPGLANTGGGGGGGGSGAPSPGFSGYGGSGTVIARFPNTRFRTA